MIYKPDEFQSDDDWPPIATPIDTATPAMPTPQPVGIAQPTGATSLPCALPVPARKGEPGITDLLIGVAIAWAVDILLSFSVGLVAAIKGAIDGISPVQVMERLSSMAWLLLPTVLISNLCAVTICWYFMCRRYGRSFADGLALHRLPWRYIGLSLVIAPSVVAFLSLSFFATMELDNNVPIVQLVNGGGIGLFAFFAVVVAPMEEIYYRGFVYPILRRYMPPALAIPIVAVWFTAIHAFQLQGAMIALVPIFFMALTWTWLREASKSLWPSIVCHVTYNAGLMALNLMQTS